MCLDILGNKTWYQTISFNWIDNFMVEFYSLVDEAFHNGTITLWQYIRNPHPRIPTFYCLPKIHKQGVLRGRPFFLCQRHYELLTVHGWSLSHMGSFLVTIDIECLYNSIPHSLGLQAIVTYLEQMHQDSMAFN